MSLEIEEFPFQKSALSQLGKAPQGRNWPVVYVLEGGQEAYIGETTGALRRIGQHLDDPKRKGIRSFHVIKHEKFNRSATTDLESRLIEYAAADGTFLLQNGNGGLRNHNYFEREFYRKLFDEVWAKLIHRGLAKKSLKEIRNSDLFKYSPYKALSDDQSVVAEKLVEKVQSTEKSVSIVQGEPGSGKTILAIYLAKFLTSELEGKNLRVGIVLPQTSLRGTVRKIFRHVKGLKPRMVLGPSDVANDKVPFDVLIVDEAHRLTQRRKLASYKAFDDASKALDLDPLKTSQLDWILQRCRHTVLLYDPKQSVKPSDVRPEMFGRLNPKPEEYQLKSQLRVLAGDQYTGYIDAMLRNRPAFRPEFVGYDLRQFRNLGDLIEQLRLREAEHGLCRLVAGYAWEWKSRGNPTAHDIEIDGLRLRWNSTVEDWINSPGAANEVGCIHTVQGYDLNYVGVIIGPELAYDGQKLVFRPEHYKDHHGNDRTLSPDAMMDYIVNIYKTLMTRGILGTYIYACDEALAAHLADYLEVVDDLRDSAAAEPRPTN